MGKRSERGGGGVKRRSDNGVTKDEGDLENCSF